MAVRNVLVTTLSTLSRNERFFYYYATIDGERKYFTGVSTNEPGAKYLLATQPIDRIVMIGSDKTYKPGQNSDRRMNEVSTSRPSDCEMSALSFLEYRLAQFVRDEELDWERRINVIDPKRRTQLQTIVHDVMTGKGYDDRQLWFDVLNENSDLAAELKKHITTNIQENYARPEDYAEYSSANIREFPELKQLEEGDISTLSMIGRLKQMEEEAFSSLLDKEAFLLLGVTTVEKRITALELERQKKQNEALKAIIVRLQQFNSQLQIELRDVKSQRVEEEIAYTGQYLYDELDGSQKMHALRGEHQEELKFVPLMRGDIDNISGIIRAIYSSFPEEDEIRLFVDVQGGGRTDAFIRNQIFTVLVNETDSRISIGQIISSGFEFRNFANPMKDETERYRINDLVSGMHAFVNYGKVGKLKLFFQNQPKQQDYMTSLMEVMENIDHAISLCDVERLEKNILQLRIKLNEQPDVDDNAAEIFAVLRDGIQRDYGKLLESDTINPVELIRWARQKEMIQQTLTIIESKTPELIVQNGLLYYPSEECELLERIRHDKSVRSFRGQPLDHLFIKGYPSYLNQLDNLKNRSLKDAFKQELNRINKRKRGTDRDSYGPGRLTVGTILPESDRPMLWKMIGQYYDLCDKRNQICHASSVDGRPEFTTICEDIDRFIHNLEALLQISNDSLG